MPPTERERGGAKRFEALVPWPPVPGDKLSIVWSVDPSGRGKMTQTSAVIAAWRGVRIDRWSADGCKVYDGDEVVVTTVTSEAAHALAASLNTVGAGQVNSSRPFAARGSDVTAGTDALGAARGERTAGRVAERLNAHPAVQLLGAGIAVAADPTVDGYQLDPGWLMSDGPQQTWTQRVKLAGRLVGVTATVEGSIERWTIHAAYRSIPFTIEATDAHVSVEALGEQAVYPTTEPTGPLTTLFAVLQMIDGFDQQVVIAAGLERFR